MASGPTELAMTLVGSVALLLWGVRQVRVGVTGAFGTELRRLLAAASRRRWRAFLMGGFVSGLLQSATATALLVGAFAGQKLVALPLALTMMLGADVGSTLAAQLLAFDVKALWAVLVATGVGLAMATDAGRTRGLARIAFGIGVMLLSLREISAAATVLQHSELFRGALEALASAPTLAVVVMALATWAVHSSLAMILFTMSLAHSGAVPPTLALALVLGANLGGAAAPFLALSGSPAAARRVPLGNLLMRGLAVAAVLPWLGPLSTLTEWLGGGDPARLVANAHTLFNVVVAGVFLPLCGPVASLIERILPEPPADNDPGVARHLDPNLVMSPPEALACAMREALELGNHVSAMVRRIPEAMTASDVRVVREIEKLDDIADRLFESLKLYLVKASRAEMTEEEGRRAMEIVSFATHLEHIGDIIDKNLMELAAKRARKGLAFSQEGRDELLSLHAIVMANMALAMNVFATRDVDMARRLVAEKSAIRVAERHATKSHYARLRAGRLESMETSAIHLDVVRDLKRIHGHLASTAYPILEAAGELSDSRLKAQDEKPPVPAVSGARAPA
ncbi:Na/Pi cotransporter family protein [Phreatobacter stygius]|nr:Na/Pi cotransporter family protein [Phreatobacter stygius]